MRSEERASGLCAAEEQQVRNPNVLICQLAEDGESEMDGVWSYLQQHWQSSLPLSRTNIVASSFQVVMVVLWGKLDGMHQTIHESQMQEKRKRKRKRVRE